METNCLAMIVPYYWNNKCLPTLQNITDGYESYVDDKITSNSNLVKPITFSSNWSIKQIDNGSENI